MAGPERVISVRTRTILLVLSLTLLVVGTVFLAWQLWRVLLWLLAAVILAAALNPLVEFFERRRLNRAFAALLVLVLTVLVISGLAYVAIPPLVSQVTDFVEAIPELVSDLTAGEGPLGFLQRDYQIVDRVKEAVEQRGAGGIFGITERGLGVAKSVLSAVISLIAVVFLTLFMLIQGPRTIRWQLSLLPETARPRWERAGRDVYRTVGGYVTGNLVISVIAGTIMGITLWIIGSDFALALAVIVAFFDLIPLVGATLAAVIVVTVTSLELGWVRGVIVARAVPRLPAVRESRAPAADLRADGAALAARRARRRADRRGARRDPRRPGGDSRGRGHPGRVSGGLGLPARGRRCATGAVRLAEQLLKHSALPADTPTDVPVRPEGRAFFSSRSFCSRPRRCRPARSAVSPPRTKQSRP